MRVFDFDSTIYNGESCIDFFLFSLPKHPKNILLIPRVFYMLYRYKKLKVSSKELVAALEKYASNFLKEFSDLEADIKLFWDKHEHKIKNFYLQKKDNNDVILSASPDFLIKEIASRLGIKNVIASNIDIKNGKIKSLCYHKNKCARFKENFPETVIDEFYTDSLNDRAVFEISENVYLVTGNKIKKIK